MDFYEVTKIIFEQIKEYCTLDSCRVMKAKDIEYMWRDKKSKQYKSATAVSAREYIKLALEKVEKYFGDEKTFPDKELGN